MKLQTIPIIIFIHSLLNRFVTINYRQFYSSILSIFVYLYILGLRSTYAVTRFLFSFSVVFSYDLSVSRNRFRTTVKTFQKISFFKTFKTISKGIFKLKKKCPEIEKRSFESKLGVEEIV